ncbi:metabotropic glutamate receptor [Saccoglossus kowalevskii]|uniref:Metabotropic glutamate receptor n=1 Tax=Saccoglossus kowalevskii TaxID=10224 RepID=D1LX28_SACKO|nr:metabotropic glutamate receptor [Saccoglossus kowalevskii]ACY92534.1 metabotropic glutamate receptor [Saccoglossus kowalevskii]
MLTLSGAQNFGVGRPGDIMATIGALISDVSMEMLRITGPLQKTQVSFGSTSYELEDREKYPNFLRTVPSDDRQADVMVSLLMKHGWIYVSTVKSDTVYGNSGMEAFIKKANDAGICVSIELTIPVAATSGNYLSVMTDLLTMGGDKGSNVVVLFTNHHDTRELMKTAKTSARPMPDQPYHLTWVAPDAWGIYSDVVAGLLDETKGAFTIIPLQVPLPLFETYFRSLTPSDNSRNPWFNYLWESIFECSKGTCDGQESLTDVEDSRLHSALSSFAINAVYATAAGLHRLLVNKCPDLKLCQNFFESTPLEVFVAIEEVNIEEAAGGRPFSFAREAGEGGYTIMNYVVDENEMAGNYRWVGEWIDNELVINDSLVQYYDFSGDRQPYIRSRCPKFCTECYKQGVSPLVVPDSPPLEFYGDTIWAVIILAVCAIGMLFCFVIFIYFLIEFRHPVVKGASSSLSYFLLLGITLLFILNLAFMLSPTISVCGAQRFGLSFFHAIIWSALLCKIIRILRVCGKGEINTKIAFVSPWSQTFLMLALLTVQLVITGEWLILDPPAVEHEIRETNTKPPYELVWMCSYDNKWLVTSLVYVFILLLVTLWCAVPARKYSELLHEGAYILSCCIVSIFIMLAWILIYMLADEEYQHPALCVGITTNAFVILALMFMPKINALTTPRAKDEDDGTTGNDMGKSYVYSNPDVNKDDEVTAF